MPNVTEGDLEIPISYVRWKVNTWNKYKNYIDSPGFMFQGREWCLIYYIGSSDLYIYLKNKSNGSYAPFDVSLNVVSGSTGQIIPELTGKNHFDNYSGYWTICTKPLADILRLDPEYRRTHCLKFVVVLKADDPLTDTDSKAIQTECNPTEDIEVHCATASTTLFPNSASCLDSLSDDLSKLMVQGSDVDVEFQCAGQSIKALGAIVSARSPVIACMLSSDMIEGKTKVVKIPNMELDIFQQFLKYLYSGKLDELTFDTAISLYETGQQYAVHALSKRCSDFLKGHLTVENACEALFVADAHSDADFVKAAVDFLLEHKVPETGDCWPDFCNKHPKLANIVLTRYCKMLSKCEANS